MDVRLLVGLRHWWPVLWSLYEIRAYESVLFSPASSLFLPTRRRNHSPAPRFSFSDEACKGQKRGERADILTLFVQDKKAIQLTKWASPQPSGLFI